MKWLPAVELDFQDNSILEITFLPSPRWGFVENIASYLTLISRLAVRGVNVYLTVWLLLNLNTEIGLY